MLKRFLEGVSMKRNVLALIFILSAFLVYGQNTPTDVVLILDTSSAMSSSYENVNNYITGSFLSEFLRVGDTFHLIAFSDSPRLDIARRITSNGDVETIIGRMLIQYPVESGSNVSSAISYAEQYVASLPARPKKIVLISTGSGDTNNLVAAAKQRLNSRNASFDFVQVTSGQPLANLPSSGRPAASRATASPAASTSPAPATPSAVQQTQTPTPSAEQQTTTTPQQSAGTTEQTAPVTPPSAAVSSGSETDKDTSAVTSETGETGTLPGVSDSVGLSGSVETEDTGRQAVESQTSDPVRETVTPSPLLPEEQKKGTGTAWASSMPFIIGIIILALIILGIIVFFVTRKLGSSPNRVMAQAATSKPESEDTATFTDHSKDLAKYAAVQNKKRSTPYDNRPKKTESSIPAVINPSGPLLLNLFVEDQNTSIGKRNIHSLKSGYSLSVGGGQSDFLIFLVPIPANIGEIRRNGSQCSFIPKKPKYFPDLGSSELVDCINKTIRVISDKNYELRFRFEMYEDPLVAINRVLMSVNVPG